MPNLFRNNAATTLASPVLTSDTTLVLATNTGARFPTPVIGEWFFVTVQSGVNFEIMKCTARAGDILTVERAQDGSSLQNWLAGNSVDMRIPRITLENFVQKNEVALLAAGSAAVPSVAFGDADTGIYGPTAGEIGFTLNATEFLRLSALALSYSSGSNNVSLSYDGAIEVTKGGGGAYIDFKNAVGEDADARIFEVSNGIGFQTGGNGALATRMVINSAGQIQSVGSGTAAAPAYSFSGDTDTGIFSQAANALDMAAGGQRVASAIPNNFYVLGDSTITESFLMQYNGGASASAARGLSLVALNENFVAQTTLRSVINTDGSGNIELYATPAGSRASDRRVLRGTFPGSGPIALVGPVNVSSGDLDVAGNLRFNSGYGSAALAFGVRAWVNFDGINLVNLNGTYSQSGTTVTVNATNHGLSVGHTLFADITSGTGVDGTYTVASVVDANTFTYTAGTSLTTSGNISLPRCVVRGAGNIGSVVRIATGDYVVNFTIAMPDTTYVAIANTSNTVGGANAVVPLMWTAGRATVSCRFGCSDNNTDALFNAGQIDFTVIR